MLANIFLCTTARHLREISSLFPDYVFNDKAWKHLRWSPLSVKRQAQSWNFTKNVLYCWYFLFLEQLSSCFHTEYIRAVTSIPCRCRGMQSLRKNQLVNLWTISKPCSIVFWIYLIFERRKKKHSKKSIFLQITLSSFPANTTWKASKYEKNTDQKNFVSTYFLRSEYCCHLFSVLVSHFLVVYSK